MASAIIHLAVAKELLKRIKVDNQYDYYLGSIAPDIAKQIGISRDDSHFIKNTFNGIPNIALFKQRYPNVTDYSFNVGYFTHLYTDKIWIEEFLPNYTSNNSIRLLNGTILETTEEEIKQLLYSDYTNLNVQLIEEYDMDLSLFYEPFKMPYTTIEEIPVEKLDILINKMGIIIANSKPDSTYTLDLSSIKEFIEKCVNEIEKELINY